MARPSAARAHSRSRRSMTPRSSSSTRTRLAVACLRPRRSRDAEFVKQLEPQPCGEKSGCDEKPALLRQNPCREGERQEDQHEGGAEADHLHAVPFRISVPPQEHPEEHEKRDLGIDGEEDARTRRESGPCGEADDGPVIAG